MTTQLPQASAYVETINSGDAAAFLVLFAENAVVDDGGREFRGRAAIQTWSQREIFDARVSLEPIARTDQSEEAQITTIADGNFDRTGLPDPVVIVHRIKVAGDRIVGLTCRLAEAPVG